MFAGVVSAGVGCTSTTSIEQACIRDSTKRFELRNVVAMSTAPDHGSAIGKRVDVDRVRHVVATELSRREVVAGA